jgi:hypothetical protein
MIIKVATQRVGGVVITVVWLAFTDGEKDGQEK